MSKAPFRLGHKGMSVEEAIEILLDQLYDAERKDWEANDCPDEHTYHALMTLAKLKSVL